MSKLGNIATPDRKWLNKTIDKNAYFLFTLQCSEARVRAEHYSRWSGFYCTALSSSRASGSSAGFCIQPTGTGKRELPREWHSRCAALRHRCGHIPRARTQPWETAWEMHAVAKRREDMEIGEELDNLCRKMFITLGLSSSVNSLITSLSFFPWISSCHSCLSVSSRRYQFLVGFTIANIPICLPDHLGYWGLSPLRSLIFT